MVRITENDNITHMTTFGLPAECGRLIEYSSPADLETLYDDRTLFSEFIQIGGGSNLLFVNGRYDGTVLHCADKSVEWLNEYSENPVMLCGAGLELDEACRIAAEKGLWGLENLSGIPGSVGGACVQNAGAYGVEIKDVLDYLEVFDNSRGEGAIHTMDCGDCHYGYRDSIFKQPENRTRLIIAKVAFALSTRPNPILAYKGVTDELGVELPLTPQETEAITPSDIRCAILAIRSRKLPNPDSTGSAGSFFKNPVVTESCYRNICTRSGIEPSGHRLPDGKIKISAAWLIDKAGCKDFTRGGASLWPSQPLVIVNSHNATGEDVYHLCQHIIATVENTFGVRLSPEVVFI